MHAKYEIHNQSEKLGIRTWSPIKRTGMFTGKLWWENHSDPNAKGPHFFVFVKHTVDDREYEMGSSKKTAGQLTSGTIEIKTLQPESADLYLFTFLVLKEVF